MFVVVLVIPARGADVSGKWDFNADIDTGSFVFKQDGEKLTGTYYGGYGEGEAELSGRVNGNKIEFEFTLEVHQLPGGLKVRYEGTIESDDTMKGTATYAVIMFADWTAKRAK